MRGVSDLCYGLGADEFAIGYHQSHLEFANQENFDENLRPLPLMVEHLKSQGRMV